MDAKARNAIAAASRGNMAAIQAANREQVIAARTDLATRQNRHTSAVPVKAPSGFRGSRGRRPGRDKGQNEWRTTSQYYRTAATHDARWSQTVSQVAP